MRRGLRASWLVAAVALAIASGGCYKRVIGAKGLGAADVDVYEPDYEPTRVERALFPEPKRARRPGW